MTDEELYFKHWQPRTIFPIPESEYKIPKTWLSYHCLPGSPSFPAVLDRDKDLVARAEYNLALRTECQEHHKEYVAFLMRKMRLDFPKALGHDNPKDHVKATDKATKR